MKRIIAPVKPKLTFFFLFFKYNETVAENLYRRMLASYLYQQMRYKVYTITDFNNTPRYVQRQKTKQLLKPKIRRTSDVLMF